VAQYQIVLDGKTYEFSGPLKFKLISIVEPASAQIEKMRRELNASGEPFNRKFYDELSTIIVTVLNHVDPKFTREAFGEIPVTPDDLLAAYKQIMIASGLWKTPSEAEGKTASPNPQSPLTGA